MFKFDPNRKLILSVGDEVLTHQYKAHGIKVDAQDNVWICDANGSTIKKISPDGKVAKIYPGNDWKPDEVIEAIRRLHR